MSDMPTLDSSRQEVFDYVVGNLIKQGRPSLAMTALRGHDHEPQLSCAYRGQGGSRCAAGWLIPDEVYDGRRMEGLCVSSLLTKYHLPVIRRYRGIVSELQDAHDSSWGADRTDDAWVVEFKHRARRVAGEYQLEWKHG